MKNLGACLVTIFALALGVSAQSPACGPHGGPGTVFITAKDLAAQLHDPALVVLAVTDDRGREYGAGHIPGALLLDASTLWRKNQLSVELPGAQELAGAMTKLGISPQSRIVLYPSGAGDTHVSRTYWTLDAIGLGARTSILDGGLDAWKAAGQPLVRQPSKPAQRAAFPPCLQKDLYADAAFVEGHLHAPGIALVDARAEMDYSGDMEMMGRRGHIPGAVNIPEPSLISNGRYLSLDALRQKFTAAGIKRGDTVVSYCHIGLMATEVYVAARALGFEAKLYDGSFEDWAAHKDFPVERSPAH